MSNRKPSAVLTWCLLALGVSLAVFVTGCEGQLGLREGRGITLLAGDAGSPPGDAGFAPSDAGITFSGTDANYPDAYTPPGCAPSCSGFTCGSDGCGGSCGTCGAGTTCMAHSCVATPPADPPPTGGGTHAVTVYGADWCGACHAARAFLDGAHVTYTYRDIDDAAAQQELVNRAAMLGYPLSGSVSLPVMVIDSTMTEGWSESRARSALGL